MAAFRIARIVITQYKSLIAEAALLVAFAVSCKIISRIAADTFAVEAV
jgi:hypothetical protein